MRLFFAILLSSCATYAPQPPPKWVADAPIVHFQQVRDGLYRGGHPSSAGLDWLKERGVKTIVDLEIADIIEASPRDIEEERREANARGFQFVHAPMSAFEPALSRRFDEQIDRVLAVLADPDAQPVYVHCKHGQDRTGLVIGLERVYGESWKPERAYAEMVRNGFHTSFVGLDGYFKRKTGYF